MLGEQLVVDQPHRLQVHGHGFEVEQWNAELSRGRHGDVAGVGRPARHQLRYDAGLALARGVDRLEHRGFFDHAILHEPLWQPAKARARGAERERGVVIHGLTASKISRTVSLPETRAGAIVKSLAILNYRPLKRRGVRHSGKIESSKGEPRHKAESLD